MKNLLSILATILIVGNLFGQFTANIDGGEQLQSIGDTVKVKLPFETEYKINLQNQDNFRRVLVNIRIDGRSVTGEGLIMRTGESVALERFIDSGTLTKGAKFKFVDKAEAIADGRKPNKEDGLIFIKVQYESPVEKIVKYQELTKAKDYFIVPQWHNYYNNLGSFTPTSCLDSQNISVTSNISVDTQSDICAPGVTEEGSESRQRFQEEKVGELEGKAETLIIRLVGYYKDKPILLNK